MKITPRPTASAVSHAPQHDPLGCWNDECGADDSRAAPGRPRGPEGDEQFWDRLHGMPFVEAEQECVMRREKLVEQNARLQADSQMRKAGRDAGAAIHHIQGQLSRLNERIKYLRKLQDRISWHNAVRDLFGPEAVEQCLVHMGRLTEGEAR